MRAGEPAQRTLEDVRHYGGLAEGTGLPGEQGAAPEPAEAGRLEYERSTTRRAR